MNRKTIRLAISWIVLGALCAACGVGDPSSSPSSSGANGAAGFAPSAPAEPPAPAVEVSACAVQSAYQRNEIAALQEYPTGQRVIVTGRVRSVAVSLGTMIVHPAPCLGCSVRLADDQAAAAGALSRGQAFRASCTTGNFFVGISFDDCRLVE